MANVAVTQQSSVPAGQVLDDGAATTTDFFYWPNNGRDILLVTNASGGSIDVTINRYATYDGDTVADRVVAVPDGKTVAIGPFDQSIYNAPSGALEGNTIFAFSDDTGVTFQVIRVQ